MSTPALQRAWQAARRRRAAAVLLFWLPLALLPALLSWRLGAGTAAWLVLLASVAALAVLTGHDRLAIPGGALACLSARWFR